MLPVIALVGRPNVGKSTLFNCLTRTRDALVADYPGLTRDRQYGRVKRGTRDCLVVDTGGFGDSREELGNLALRQIGYAIDEADLILFLVDARAGLNPDDEAIAGHLRKTNKPVILIANKVDGLDPSTAGTEFHALALGPPVLITAAHGRGIPALIERLGELLPETPEQDAGDQERIAIAVVGRPNVGKSTLINRLLGEERVVVFDQPGTTRDSLYIPFERNGAAYTLIDTAGMRRRSKISGGIEKFSVIKSMQAIDRANVVIYLIDASEGVTDQDAALLGMILEAGRALIIGLNKWDGLSPEQREKVKRQLDVKLPFIVYAERQFLSALHGTGVGNLFDRIPELYRASMLDLSTSHLSRILSEATLAHQPPLVQGRRIKLKYAHQGGHNPPAVVIHGNQTRSVPASYRRYLANTFREKLGLEGVPIRLEFKSADNPFQGQRNHPSERQLKKRKRLMRHVKKRG
ncbi:MAG: ribosome biogenesis GTPase Der [Methylococcaceae bacterium]|nr:ribosome biogenesis GTPase Der [Methylococcaceae bacterium]MCI0733758.1 ribosome biogenesis GTPase Der [Methylococcaceae bacterium]